MAYDPTATRSGAEFSTNPFYQGAWLCYINGIAVPIQGFTVTHGVWQIPNFTIDLIPDLTLMNLGQEDLVQVALFYLDHWVDPEHPEWRLLVDGEIVGKSIRMTPNGRMLSFRCMSHIRTLQQLFFFYMTNVEDVVAAQDPALRASGFATEGLSYPYALFHKGLRLTGAEATALNGTGSDAAGNGDAIKAPFEFVYNVIRGVISKEVPDDKRSLPMMNFFARHIRTTRMHNRFVRQPILEDASVLAERKGVFPIFEAARNEQALLAMQRHTASQLSNSGSVYSIVEQVLRLVYMELSMIPNPACVQVTLAAEEDGKIIAGVTGNTPTQDIRGTRPISIPSAGVDTETTSRDRELARMALQLGREPTVHDLEENGLAGSYDTHDALGVVNLGNATELIAHYRETLRRRGVQPAALLDELDPNVANQTRDIDTYDIAIANEVVRTGRLPAPAADGETGYSAGMIAHYRDTVRLTGMTPQALSSLTSNGAPSGSAAQAPTRLAIAVNQERERAINARRNAEAQAAREAEDARQQAPYQEGVPPTAPMRLAQYAVKPQFLFGVAPACNVIYPSMDDGWSSDEDYTAQPTRIYVNDSAYTRLLRAQGANRDFMLHALTVAYPEEANAVMHHRIVGPNGMANTGAHETGKDMLIWPEEYYAGPKVARMALSPWFQTMVQWRNSDGAGTPSPTGTPVPSTPSVSTTPTPSNRVLAAPSSTTPPSNGSIQTSEGQYVTVVNVPVQRASSLIGGRAQGPGGGTSFGGRGTRSNITGLSGYQFHAGDDYLAAEGLPVFAALGGQVVMALRNFEPGTEFYGNIVVIHHGQQGTTTDAPDGVATVYAHMSSITPGLHAGQTVNAGDPIGFVGATGGSVTERNGYALAYGVEAAAVTAASTSTRNGVLALLGQRRISQEGIRLRAEAARLYEQYGAPAHWPAALRRQKMFLNIPDTISVQIARAIGGFFRDDPAHLHFEVLRQSARGARPSPVRIDRESRTVTSDPMHRLTPKAWLDALGISVGTGSSASRRGRIGIAASGVPDGAATATIVHTDETATLDAGRQVVDSAVTRTVTRPTTDGLRAAMATPGVLETQGQATDVSNVPREVVAAGLDPQDEFQKLFYLYAQYEFFKQRYEARICGTSMRFNPYIIAGFPSVLFDSQKTGLHSVSYVQQVTHSASVGPMGSMQTTVQFIATRLFSEFFADVRRDSELFSRRVDSAPAEMIPEIREALQVKEQAEAYYQRLLYGYREPANGKPAAFDIKSAVGYQTAAGDVEPIVIEESAQIHRVNDYATAPTQTASVTRRDVESAQAALTAAQERERFARARHTAVVEAYNRTNGGRPSLFPSGAEQLALEDMVATQSLSFEAQARTREAQHNLDVLQQRVTNQGGVDESYSPPVVEAVTTSVSHNIEPNRELAPLPGVYTKAFEEYQTAMQLASRPICTLNDYIRFWHGGESVGSLLEDKASRKAQVEGEVNTFAYASVISRDVNTTGGGNGPATTNAVRNTATYYRRIYRLRQGPGPMPAPAERGYTDPPYTPSNESAGVTAPITAAERANGVRDDQHYPETRTNWDAVLLSYADKIRNIQFER